MIKAEFIILSILTITIGLSRTQECSSYAQAVYRFYNPTTEDRLYSINSNEQQSGYNPEGEGFYSLKTWGFDTLVIYKLSRNSFHRYVASEVEKSQLILEGWNDEGTIGYAFQNKKPGTKPLYFYKKANSDVALYTIYPEFEILKDMSRVGVVGYVFEECPLKLDDIETIKQTNSQFVSQCTGNQQQPIFKWWNQYTNDYLFTVSPDGDNAMQNGYSSSGVAFYTLIKQEVGTLPLYSLYLNPSHFYTSDQDQKNEKIRAGWEDLGTIGNVYQSLQAKSLPLLHYYNSDLNRHLYTSHPESENMDSWQLIDITGYVLDDCSNYRLR
jgi:hypothetical protein